MNIDKRVRRISEKSQLKLDKMVIIIGLSLVAASCCSYFVIDAFGQQQDFVLDCPKNAYHGIDRQGNEACRDILTNQILESESVVITDFDSEKIIDLDSEKTPKSDSQIITLPETREVIGTEETPIVEITILALIGIVGSIFGVIIKKRKLKIFQRYGWSSIQKEQVRNRQYGKCNMCFTSPSKWKYDYFDGNKNNNDLDNCQGLCPDCFSVKTERDIQISIYQ